MSPLGLSASNFALNASRYPKTDIFRTMYSLIAMILLMLPSFGFAKLAQPTNSLNLTTASLTAVNAIGPEPIDPRFNIQAVYQEVPVDEPQVLVAAVQFLGELGAKPFLEAVSGNFELWDDHCPNVVFEHHASTPGGTIQTRFLVWGLYLGVKDMILTNRFKEVRFVLRWERQVVGIALIENHRAALSMSSTNSTSDIQRRAALDPLRSSPNERRDGALFNLTMPNTYLNVIWGLKVVATAHGKPLSRRSIILAFLDAVLAVSSRPVNAVVESPVQVEPPAPYHSKLQIVPQRTPPQLPDLMYGAVATGLRLMTLSMLGTSFWREVNFVFVATKPGHPGHEAVLATCALYRG